MVEHGVHPPGQFPDSRGQIGVPVVDRLHSQAITTISFVYPGGLRLAIAPAADAIARASKKKT